ncbi:unnamed protein product, partial [Rotaria socialis]
MSTADEILVLAEKFSLYFTIVIFVTGTIGNLLNFGVLTTSKRFRSNQCAFYLIIESIVDTCQLSIIFIIYILPFIYGFSPGNIFIVWCKLKNILPQVFRLLSTSMVCFAAFDQFLCTNPQCSMRRISSIQLARRLTLTAICIWTIHGIPYAIFYQIIPSNGCIITNTNLIHYYSYFYYPILHGLFPILTSCLFSLLAYRNVRHLVRRQVAVVRRRLDRQLTAMVFLRVIFFVLLLTPYTIYRIYSLNVLVSITDLGPYAVDQLIYSIMASLINLNYSTETKDEQNFSDDDLICPITQEIFRDPVRAADGFVYERDAISRWILQKGTSPLTRKPLRIDELRPDEKIRHLARRRRRSTVSYDARNDTVSLPPLRLVPRATNQISPIPVRPCQTVPRVPRVECSKKRMVKLLFLLFSICTIVGPIVGMVL